MDAAEHILRAGGIDELTIPAIAAKSGVSVGNIYRRFEGKQDILRALKNRLYDELEETTSKAMIAPAESLRSAVHRFAVVSITEMERQGELYMLIVSSQGDDAEMIQRGRDIISKNLAVLRNSLLPFWSEIVHDDPERAVQMSFTTLLAAMERRVVHRATPPATLTWDEFGQELTHIVVAYLTTAV